MRNEDFKNSDPLTRTPDLFLEPSESPPLNQLQNLPACAHLNCTTVQEIQLKAVVSSDMIIVQTNNTIQ